MPVVSQCLESNGALCVCLLQVEASFFKNYYSTLPSTLRNMPIFWTEEELQWLKGSYIVQQIQERKAAIRKDYDVICRVSVSPVTLGLPWHSPTHCSVPRRSIRRSRDSRSSASVGRA